MTHFTGKAAKALFLGAMTTLLLSVSAMAADGDLAVGAGVTTGSSLRLRSEASTSSSILTTLNKDVTLAVLDTSTAGWYKFLTPARPALFPPTTWPWTRTTSSRPTAA